ncbi:MAG: glycoside hydrolase family 9 protein [Uliginosibacterium sp.]|nr:glycoside hydrolase family 9 protein [Uliginosibacterium sp.]
MLPSRTRPRPSNLWRHRVTSRFPALIQGLRLTGAALCLLPLIASAAKLDEELLSNGNWQATTDPWWVAAASLKIEDGMGCAKFDKPGSNPWDVILGQSGLSLKKDADYRLRFTLRADTASKLKVVVQHDGPPYTASFVQEGLAIGPEAKVHEFSFRPAADDAKVTFQLQVGAELANRICLGKVSLVGPKLQPPKAEARKPVRLNQLGYLNAALKRATIASDAKAPLPWRVVDAQARVLAEGMTTVFGRNSASGEHLHVADFSALIAPANDLVLEVAGDTSHPFVIGPDLYRKLKLDALNFFYQQRSGTPIEAAYVQRPDLARPAGHTTETVSCFKGRDDKGNQWPGCDFSLNVTGGWYDAGDHGKYVVNGGIATWTLVNQYERSQRVKTADPAAFANGKARLPEHANSRNDLLDEARWMMDFMLAMQVPDGKQVWVPVGDQSRELTRLELSKIDASGMVFHKVADAKWTGLPTPPHKDPQPRQLSYPSTAATLNLAATAAQCVRVWRSIDPTYADTCLRAAERAWQAANRHPEVYAYDNFTGSGPYEDYDVSDEFYWAAAELFATTGHKNYETALRASPHFLATPKGDLNGSGDLFWAKLTVAGTLTLATEATQLDPKLIAQARQALIATADAYLAQAREEGYLIPFKALDYQWGSNSAILNRSLILGHAYDFTGERKYLQAIADSMDYMLGRNPLDQSYVTGYGARPAMNPHHRFWAHQNDPNSPMPPPGVLVGGPNSVSFSDPVAVRLKGKCTGQTCWIDDIGAWSLNEIAVNWNAPLLWATSLLDEGGLAR